MEKKSGHTWQGIALVAVMTAVLVALAVLQYRWIGEISRAEESRLRWSIENATQQFRREFNFELRRICGIFQTPASPVDGPYLGALTHRLADWRIEDRYSSLLLSAFVLRRRDGGGEDLLEFDRWTRGWKPVSWPENLGLVRTDAWCRSADRSAERTVAAAGSWRVFPSVPALVRVLPEPAGSTRAGAAGLLILHLDAERLQNEFFPDLARKHFGGQDPPLFDTAVLSGERAVIFGSGPKVGPDWAADPDTRVQLLYDRTEFPGNPETGHPAGLEGSEDGTPDLLPESVGQLPSPYTGPGRFPGPLPGEGRGWQLLARYHAGPLDDLVRTSRNRNLGVSFGVLMLLGAGMWVLFLALRRLQRLARLERRFVAGVSHDLRTPLAVISSAADNLAEGVVEGSRSREYGVVIRAESRKLNAMVEQILHYADVRRGKRPPVIAEIDAREAVQAAVEAMEPAARLADVVVETRLPEDRCPTLADRDSLIHVVHNLLDNALRHAADGRRVEVCVEQLTDHGGDSVEIRVSDHGPGIDAAEASQVFEPFFRGRKALRAGVPGSGLGLSLAREKTVALGGDLRLDSTPGRGSTFSLRLPAVPAAAANPR